MRDLNLPKKTMQGWLITGFGLCLVGVSMLAEIQTLISYADSESLTEQGLALAMAVGLIGCQFVFVGAAIHVWKTHKPLAWLLAFFTLLLFVLSVSGTAATLQSWYATDTNKTLKSSDEYKTQQVLIKQLLNESVEYKNMAQVSKSANHLTKAGEQLDKSKDANRMAQQALLKLQTMQPHAAKSGEALAGVAGDYKWVIWYVLAVLIDVCPMLCFAFLTVMNKPIFIKSEITKTPTVKTQTPTVKTPTVETQTPTVKAPPSRRITKANKNEIAQEIRTEILNREFGDVPGVRAVMRTKNISNHGFVKSVFDLMGENGELTRQENKTWLLAL